MATPTRPAPSSPARGTRPPNVVFVFADQWRAQAFGYRGDLAQRANTLAPKARKP